MDESHVQESPKKIKEEDVAAEVQEHLEEDEEAMRVAVKHHGVVRHHEDTARRQLKEYEGTIGGQVAQFREEDVMEDASYQDFLEPPAPEMWRMSEERLNKAYPCQYCGMSFAQNWLLKRHWKTHTGDKPFKCSICTRTFSLRDSCVRHLRTVHKELVVSDDVSGLVEDLGGHGGNSDQGLGIGFEPALSP